MNPNAYDHIIAWLDQTQPSIAPVFKGLVDLNQQQGELIVMLKDQIEALKKVIVSQSLMLESLEQIVKIQAQYVAQVHYDLRKHNPNAT